MWLAPVDHVRVVEDVVERPAAVMFPDDVCSDPLLLGRARAQERKETAEELSDRLHGGDCILDGEVPPKKQAGRFAERVIEGVDDAGSSERIVVWIERKEGGVWAVGRAVNPQHRQSVESRPDDYVFQRKAEIEGLNADQVSAAAQAFDPDSLVWVVVGDLTKIETPVRALNLGEVTILDADGKPVAK